jgi:hypothetical protein
MSAENLAYLKIKFIIEYILRIIPTKILKRNSAVRKPRAPKYQRIIDRDRALGFYRARAQAEFRYEDWELTLAQWCEIWPDDIWACRGREVDDLCMTRTDLDGAWSMDNVVLMTRADQLKRKEQYLRHRKINNNPVLKNYYIKKKDRA